MKLLLALIVILAGFVPAKLKMESACQQNAPATLSLDLREKIGQSAFVAVLGGFRSVIADVLFIDAYSAWERTDWTQLLLRLRQATELQPRSILFWEMAGWHMAWNAGTAALERIQISGYASAVAVRVSQAGRGFSGPRRRPQSGEAPTLRSAGTIVSRQVSRSWARRRKL